MKKWASNLRREVETLKENQKEIKSNQIKSTATAMANASEALTGSPDVAEKRSVSWKMSIETSKMEMHGEKKRMKKNKKRT